MDATERQLLLTCQRLPARLSLAQVAILLGFLLPEMSAVLSEGLLRSALLGYPKQNGHKFFSRDEILRLGQDKTWLHKATLAVSRRWQARNRSAQSVAELVS